MGFVEYGCLFLFFAIQRERDLLSEAKHLLGHSAGNTPVRVLRCAQHDTIA
jgi:hypothetical protein